VASFCRTLIIASLNFTGPAAIFFLEGYDIVDKYAKAFAYIKHNFFIRCCYT
jgi:hypothetical protein